MPVRCQPAVNSPERLLRFHSHLRFQHEARNNSINAGTGPIYASGKRRMKISRRRTDVLSVKRCLKSMLQPSKKEEP